MVRARKFLEIIEEDKLVDNAQTVGAYWLKQLQVLQKEFPAVVSNVRGKGLLLAFDVASPDLCNKIKQLAYQKSNFSSSLKIHVFRCFNYIMRNTNYTLQTIFGHKCGSRG